MTLAVVPEYVRLYFPMFQQIGDTYSHRSTYLCGAYGVPEAIDLSIIVLVLVVNRFFLMIVFFLQFIFACVDLALAFRIASLYLVLITDSAQFQASGMVGILEQQIVFILISIAIFVTFDYVNLALGYELEY
jgi:hypothetical protein